MVKIEKQTKRLKIKKVTKLPPTEEYVYDISMEDQDPFFFANDALIHNTDSAYFSAWPVKQTLEDSGFVFNEDNVVDLYDTIADGANATFAKYMIDTFNCEPTLAKRIKANREICGTSGLFVKKKLYAINVYDDEGKRPPGGKLKIMGMATQRADTPVFIQDFLKTVLKKTLTFVSEDDILAYIKEFRKEFRNKDDWALGTPKRCNGLTKYTKIENAKKGSRLPGHIRAAYNWNHLKNIYGDNSSRNITDGGKTIVCKLKKNQFNITSISYPIDEANLPAWFKALPFDVEQMEETLIDQKLSVIIGVLKMDMSKSKVNEIFDDLFE